MTDAKPTVQINMTPRGLKRKYAAAYLGVSASTFDQMRKDGTVAKPKKYGDNKLFDRHDLDDAYEKLPEWEESKKPNELDEILGAGK
mgnify:CR=1 FL=1